MVVIIKIFQISSNCFFIIIWFIYFNKDNVFFENITFVDTKKDISDLYLMSKFKNIIIANSTFSWWAAYLGLQNKKVLAPIEWFGKKRTNNNLVETKDLMPDNWLRI